MKKPYRTINYVLNSPWASAAPPEETTDRVLRSTRLEDGIYKDLRDGDGELRRKPCPPQPGSSMLRSWTT